MNINITLMFSLQHYQDIVWAYIRGLEDYAKKGGDIHQVHSVASLFVSRIDTLIDKQLELLAGDVVDPQQRSRIEGLFSERSAGDKSTLTFAAILKMAEHISGTYKVLGKADKDFEWEKIGMYALEHLDLTPYDFEGMIEVCHEQGIGLS